MLPRGNAGRRRLHLRLKNPKTLFMPDQRRTPGAKQPVIRPPGPNSPLGSPQLPAGGQQLPFVQGHDPDGRLHVIFERAVGGVTHALRQRRRQPSPNEVRDQLTLDVSPPSSTHPPSSRHQRYEFALSVASAVPLLRPTPHGCPFGFEDVNGRAERGRQRVALTSRCCCSSDITMKPPAAAAGIK